MQTVMIQAVAEAADDRPLAPGPAEGGRRGGGIAAEAPLPGRAAVARVAQRVVEGSDPRIRVLAMLSSDTSRR